MTAGITLVPSGSAAEVPGGSWVLGTLWLAPVSAAPLRLMEMPGDSFLLLVLKMTTWGRGGNSGTWSQSRKPPTPPRPAACWAESLGETQAAVHSATHRDSPPGASRGCGFIKNTWRWKLFESKFSNPPRSLTTIFAFLKTIFFFMSLFSVKLVVAQLIPFPFAYSLGTHGAQLFVSKETKIQLNTFTLEAI